jgi:hypothetical protein
LPSVDPLFKRVLVCVNVTPETATVSEPNLARDLAGAELALHPLQGAVAPDAVGRCTARRLPLAHT